MRVKEIETMLPLPKSGPAAYRRKENAIRARCTDEADRKGSPVPTRAIRQGGSDSLR